MHLGSTIRLLRLDAGLSLRDLAHRIGVSSAYLSRVEHGHDTDPTPDRLQAIARELGVPPHLLVGAAHKVGHAIEGYVEEVPSAGMLFLDIARRRLGGAEITRLRAFVEREFPAADRVEERPSLARILTPERVILQLTCPDFDEAIEMAAGRLAGPVKPDFWDMINAIQERERAASTVLGNGVMLPHGSTNCAKISAALLLLARPLNWPEAPDGVPIRLLVVLIHDLITPPPLALLAHVARLSSNGLCERLVKAKTPAEAIQWIEEIEETS
jgi:nitrogen PTS system EIIA component